MDRLELDGAFLDYEITGAGEQVALLHARPFVSWYEPLVAALSGCAVLRYRRGVPTAASAPPVEPAASGFLDPEQAIAGQAPRIGAYRASGSAFAMDRFFPGGCGDGYRDLLERLVPGAFDDALAHAEQFFRFELPAVAAWRFGPQEAAGVVQPVLNVVGAETAPRFSQGGELIQTWYPHALRCELPRSGHLLMAQEPREMARRLTQFWRAADRQPSG
jgi:hypothetical protein